MFHVDVVWGWLGSMGVWDRIPHVLVDVPVRNKTGVCIRIAALIYVRTLLGTYVYV
jgi:hypothetical protein